MPPGSEALYMFIFVPGDKMQEPIIELGVFPGSRFTEPSRETEKQKRKLPFNYMPLPLDFVDSGLMGILSKQGLKVFIALLRRADFNTGIGFIYYEQIAKDASISRSHIYKALKQLERFNLIQVITINRKRHYLRYKFKYFHNSNKVTTEL